MAPKVTLQDGPGKIYCCYHLHYEGKAPHAAGMADPMTLDRTHCWHCYHPAHHRMNSLLPLLEFQVNV